VPEGLGIKLAEQSEKQVLCQRKYQVEAVVSFISDYYV